MQGDERSNKALKSTYGSIKSNEMYQTMQTGTVTSKLTGRIKKLSNLYKSMYFVPMCI